MTQIQFQTAVLPFDETLADELKKLEAQGFQQVAGIKPIITYTLFRNVELPRGDQHAGRVEARWDDSKIDIIRNGQKVG